MVTANNMDGRGSRPIGRQSPRLVKADFVAQRFMAGVLPMNDCPEKDVIKEVEKRVSVLEVKTDTYDKLLSQNSQTLCHVRNSLDMLTRLEERHLNLDKRTEDILLRLQAEQVERKESSTRLEDRLATIEPDTGRNSHFRTLIEGVGVPLIASLISGVFVAAIAYWVFTG